MSQVHVQVLTSLQDAQCFLAAFPWAPDADAICTALRSWHDYPDLPAGIPQRVNFPTGSLQVTATEVACSGDVCARGRLSEAVAVSRQRCAGPNRLDGVASAGFAARRPYHKVLQGCQGTSALHARALHVCLSRRSSSIPECPRL